MTILLATAVLDSVLLLAALLFGIKRQPPRQEGELMRLAETKVTALMGILMIAMGYLILYEKYIDPQIAGSDPVTYFYVAGFSLICVVFGIGIMAFTFLRKIIVNEKDLVFVTFWGKKKKLEWKEIKELKVPPLTNKLTLIGRKTQFTVGGESKAYKEFLKIAKEKIKKEVGSDTLQNLLNRSLF